MNIEPSERTLQYNQSSTEDSSQSGISQSQVNSQHPCPHCGGFYKGPLGVAIHISRAHTLSNTDSLSCLDNPKHYSLNLVSLSLVAQLIVTHLICTTLRQKIVIACPKMMVLLHIKKKC